MKHSSATEFIKNYLKKDLQTFSECDNRNDLNYVFEAKVGYFTKNGKSAEYSGIAGVDKKGKICDIFVPDFMLATFRKFFHLFGTHL